MIVIYFNLPFSVYITVPSNGAIIAGFFGFLTSNNCPILSILCVISHSLVATHHKWNVFIVNCVVGSPIDCAAITPTGTPTCTASLVDRSIP